MDDKTLIAFPKRKSQIENDLKEDPNDPRYSFFTPQKSKSAVWKKFQVVKFENKTEGYAQCKACKDILTYSARSGTGSLLRHKCSKLHRNSATKVPINSEYMQDELITDMPCPKTPKLEFCPLENRQLSELKESPTELPCADIMYDNNCKNEQNNLNHEADMTEFSAMNCSEEAKSPLTKDIYDSFGENVANEMRQLRDVEHVQFQLKAAILKNILDANTAAHEIRMRNRMNKR